MLPLLPCSRLELSGSLNDRIEWRNDKDGRTTYFSDICDFKCALRISSESQGIFGENLAYSILFPDCNYNVIMKIQMKKITAVFGPVLENSPTLQREIGETLYNYKNQKATFSLTKEEVLLLLPQDRNRVSNIPVTVQFEVKTMYGNRAHRMPEFDFHEKNGDSTLAIQFGDGDKFFVNLALLSIHSHYFCSLSDQLDSLPTDGEGGLPLLELKDFKGRIFKTILDMVYPKKISVYDTVCSKKKDIPEVLRLADFLKMGVVLARFEQWLMNDDRNRLASPYQKIIWSIEYAMSTLQII